MQYLTIEQLDQLEPNSIFACGVVKDTPKGINMTNSGKDLRWVATTGSARDWALYCGFSHFSPEYIFKHGEKVTFEKHIRRIMPCSDEAFARYRK